MKSILRVFAFLLLCSALTPSVSKAGIVESGGATLEGLYQLAVLKKALATLHNDYQILGPVTWLWSNVAVPALENPGTTAWIGCFIAGVFEICKSFVRGRSHAYEGLALSGIGASILFYKHDVLGIGSGDN
ncbi:MAG: hypothetical protein M1549_00315 [Candidatus Dependentiae bacterium]|nr:hypothetical protein [Candidatus Dependentiae bacterium]